MDGYKLKGVKGQLLDYQFNFLNIKHDNIIFNGCRNASKTFLLAKTVEYNYCENVVFVCHYDGLFSTFINKIELHTNYKLISYQKDKGIATFEDNRLKGVKENLLCIYDYYKCKEIDSNIKYDYIFFENCLPFNTNLMSTKVISNICCNNSDEWLQKLYPNFNIYQVDYKMLINTKLLTKELIEDAKTECKERNRMDIFYEEYAILDDFNNQ